MKGGIIVSGEQFAATDLLIPSRFARTHRFDSCSISILVVFLAAQTVPAGQNCGACGIAANYSVSEVEWWWPAKYSPVPTTGGERDLPPKSAHRIIRRFVVRLSSFLE